MVSRKPKHLTVLALVSLTVAVPLGCSEDAVAPVSEPPHDDILFIDDKLLLDISSRIVPTLDGTNDGVFDLSGIDIIEEGRVSDFELAYAAEASSDVDVFALNRRTTQWDQIAYAKACGDCGPTARRLLFSTLGFEAMDYLDEEKRLRVRGFDGMDLSETTGIRVLQMNPRYEPVPLLVPYGGFEYKDGELLISNQDVDVLTTEGAVDRTIVTPLLWSCAIAAEGDRVWVTGYLGESNHIVELTDDGTLGQRFSLGSLFCCGMTGNSGRLWLLVDDASHRRIVEVDIQESLEAGSLVETTSFENEGYNMDAIASDGARLFLFRGGAIPSIDILSLDGSKQTSYTVDFSWSGGMTWDPRGFLWVLHSGPVQLQAGRYFVTRFRLPQGTPN